MQNGKGNANENFIWKYTLTELWLFCGYPAIFEFYYFNEPQLDRKYNGFRNENQINLDI